MFINTRSVGRRAHFKPDCAKDKKTIFLRYKWSLLPILVWLNSVRLRLLYSTARSVDSFAWCSKRKLAYIRGVILGGIRLMSYTPLRSE